MVSPSAPPMTMMHSEAVPSSAVLPLASSEASSGASSPASVPALPSSAHPQGTEAGQDSSLPVSPAPFSSSMTAQHSNTGSDAAPVLHRMQESTALESGTVAAIPVQSVQLMLPEGQLARLLGSVSQYQYQVKQIDSSGLLSIEGSADGILALLAALPDYLTGERQAVVLRDGDSTVLGRYIYEPESGHLVHTSISPIGGGSTPFALNRIERLTLDAAEQHEINALRVTPSDRAPADIYADNLIFRPSSLLEPMREDAEDPILPAVTTTPATGTNTPSRGADPVVSRPTETVTAPVIDLPPAPPGYVNTTGPTVLGSGIVDRMTTQSAAGWGFAGSAFFSDPDMAVGEALTYSIVTNYVYGTGDPASWAAADYVTLDATTGYIYVNRALLAGDRGAVYLTIRATDRGGLTAEESFELFVADDSVNTTGTWNPGPGVTSGNDTVATPAATSQWIWTADGADSVSRAGLGGSDTLHGGDGADYLGAANGNDIIWGGNGNDTLNGASGGHDTLYGGDGADSLNPVGGADKSYGGEGADTIDYYPTTGFNHVIYGGSGDDVFIDRRVDQWTNSQTISGGAGMDQLILKAGTALTANFATGQWDKVSGIEMFDLQANAAHSLTFNDQYIARSGFEGNTLTVNASTIATGITVNASGMTDSSYGVSVTGGSGYDTIYGSAGVDTIDGGGNTDVVFFNITDSFTPDDQIISVFNVNYAASDGRTINFDDYANLSGQTSVNFAATSGENLTITATDTFFNNNGLTRLRVGYVDDSVYDLSGVLDPTHWIELILGGNGNTTAMAGAGDDYVWLNPANIASSTISGGSGSDTALMDYSGTIAATFNSITHTNFSSWEIFSMSKNLAHSLTFDDSYFTRGSGITGNKVTVTYAYSGVATNGMLVDGRLITNSSYTLNVTGDEAADTIYGGAGADTVSGADGSDIIWAGGGADSVDGGAVGDTIYGEEGADTLLGGLGGDTLYGGEGNDFLEDGLANWSDRLYGGEGSDTLSALHGSNWLEGGDGADSIRGGLSADTVIGGYGADTVWGGGGGGGNPGDGLNMFLYNDPNESTTAETDIIKDFGAGGDDDKLLIFGFTGIQAAAGTPAAGTVLGWTNNTDATGNGENDIIITSAINNFRLILEGAGLAADNITLTDNTNIYFNASARTQLGLGAITGSYIMGTSASDAVGVLTGTVNNDYILGLEGNDTTSAGSGNDTILGGAGGDSIDAGAGNDQIYGGDGADWMQTGDGNDTTYGGAGNDTITSTVGGNETSYGGDGADSINGAWTGVVRNMLLYGGDGNDTVYASSNSATVYGGAGDDNISTGAAFHILYGEQGNDNITGGFNGDTIYGGEGSDTINGSHIYSPYVVGNNDQLYGGSGNDYFVFTNGPATTSPSHPSARDVIYDFSGSAGEGDKIDLSAIIGGAFTFAGAVTLANAATAFAADDSVRYYQDIGASKTIIQITTTAADANLTTTDMEIELTGLHTLTAADFVL